MDAYDPKKLEPDWQRRWQEGGVFRTPEDPRRPKYYALEMFPYPSGRIHMGHVRNYSIVDVIARYHRMAGYDVLHPMGWDAFGMPAENAAVESGKHPADWTYANMEHMRTQLARMGFSFDWDREVTTCEPDYYRWEQLVFLRMFERGLAYKKRSAVNWCPKDQTVLANEQVIDGECWRCGSKVVNKEIEQWFFRITDYAEELLGDLEKLEGKWPERVVAMQRNWIGKSPGAQVKFALDEHYREAADHIEIFTTRPDTLHGATFMSIAPEHPLAEKLGFLGGREAEVKAFIERVRAERRSREEEPEKEGVFTGAYCINPLTGRRMPIWVANFVLMEYGTGAVMAVPAHDQRDFEFARKYDQRVVVVIQPEDRELDGEKMEEAWEGPGRLVNSGEFDGLPSEEGKKRIVAKLEEAGQGSAATTYRLRDWLVSRQRYWGTPIPVIYCESCGIVPVPAEQLPVELPRNVRIGFGGGSPLARHEEFTKAECPKCGKPGRRETDTMDTFVNSSWYFLRYLSPGDEERLVDPEQVRRWMPVDQYVGGIEHAVLHLLYARFFTKVLRDLEFIPRGVDEPFENLLCQGMVNKESYSVVDAEGRRTYLFPEDVDFSGGAPKRKSDGAIVEVGRIEKMSKSKKNVVDPDVLIERYGADTARLFCLFAAPPERDVIWDDSAVEGCRRFLGRLWRYAGEREWLPGTKGSDVGAAEGAAADLRKRLHKTIQAVSHDVAAPRFHFNTAVARMQELLNELYKFEVRDENDKALVRRVIESLVALLHPFCPHITEELWHRLGGEGFLLEQPWPAFDPEWVHEDEVTIAVQVNGKVRGTVTVPKGSGEEKVKELALAEPQVSKHTEGKPFRKVIFVPDRILNLVVGG